MCGGGKKGKQGRAGDLQHWSCNDNVHSSRAGLYNGISMHPYETVFVKASW